MTYKTTVTYQPEIKYVFVWHCLSDACPKCQALNGREYHDQDIFQEVLWDVFYGNIWDLNLDHSLSHLNCRCQLEVRVIVDWTQMEVSEEIKMVLPNFADMGIMEVTMPLGKSISEIRSEVDDLNKSVNGLSDNVDGLNSVLRRYLMLSQRFLPQDAMAGLHLLQYGRLEYRMLTSAFGAGGLGAESSIIGGLAGGGMVLGALAIGTTAFIQVVEAQKQADIKTMLIQHQQELENFQLNVRRIRY